jgi:hypothetical protein
VTDDPKDYLVKITIKNQRMLDRMRIAGFKTAAQLSRTCGVRSTVIGEYLSMKRVPRNRWRLDGEFNPSIVRIANALRCLPEDLFPPQHIDKPLRKNTASVTASLNDLRYISSGLRTLALPIDDQVAKRDLPRLVDKALELLSDRQRDVIERRYGLRTGDPETLADIANDYRVGLQRIRQIEEAALNKLKRVKRIEHNHGSSGLLHEAHDALNDGE